MKMVSVIIPVYKVEKFLARCVESVFSQTYINIEIILVDDGSPDQCGQMCETFASRDNRVKVLHKSNGGLSSARNAGLDIAKGDYISFVDSDDFIHPQMIEWMVQQLEQSDSDLVSSGLLRFLNERPKEAPVDCVHFTELGQEDFIEHLYPDNFGKISVTACGKLYRKQLFSGLRYPEGIIHEDLQIYMKILQKCKRISVADHELYYYYYNPNSIMQSNYLAYDRFGEFTVREQYISFFQTRGLQEQALLAANDYLTFFMRNYFAVVLRYPQRRAALAPHIQIFKGHMALIQADPYVCRMRRICCRLMLIEPHIAYFIAKKCIPDCLIVEMREGECSEY